MVKVADTTHRAIPVRELSPEVLLISAVINTGDLGEAEKCGITEDHFIGWKQHWNWLVRAVSKHGTVPDRSTFLSQYREFPLTDEENVRLTADMLMNLHYRREGKTVVQEAATLLGTGQVAEAASLMQKFQPREVSPAGTNLISDQSFLDTYYDADLGATIAFPWKPLQEATGGIRPGNLVYFAGRPGQGKSSMATHVAVSAVEQGKRVKYYSLEMTETEMRYKVHAYIAQKMGFKNITVQALMDRSVERDEYKQLMEIINESGEYAEFDVHTPRHGWVNPMTVYSSASDYDLIVIDLVSLMMNNRGQQAIQDWRVAAEISNELKQISLATTVPILGTVQINRDGASGDEAPKLHQLAQTDAYGQDADAVAVFRNLDGVAVRWHCAKARFGTGSRFVTQFDPNRMQFPVITEDTLERLQLAAHA